MGRSPSARSIFRRFSARQAMGDIFELAPRRRHYYDRSHSPGRRIDRRGHARRTGLQIAPPRIRPVDGRLRTIFLLAALMGDSLFSAHFSPPSPATHGTARYCLGTPLPTLKFLPRRRRLECHAPAEYFTRYRATRARFSGTAQLVARLAPVVQRAHVL